MPGACAPSTIASAPAARAAAQISATGRTRAVGDVICETETARVRGPILAITSSGSQTTNVAPLNSHVRVIAPYSCAVVTISSPGSRRSERMTALSARGRVRHEGDVVRLHAHERREDSRAPRRVARAARAHSRSAHDLPREEVGRPLLQLALEPLVLGEDSRRTRAVAAVVELDDIRSRGGSRHACAASVSRCGASSGRTSRPSPAPSRRSSRRSRQRLRERDHASVPLHLPAQRARDRARHRRADRRHARVAASSRGRSSASSSTASADAACSRPPSGS